MFASPHHGLSKSEMTYRLPRVIIPSFTFEHPRKESLFSCGVPARQLFPAAGRLKCHRRFA